MNEKAAQAKNPSLRWLERYCPFFVLRNTMQHNQAGSKKARKKDHQY
jgi:hypothetical protein